MTRFYFICIVLFLIGCEKEIVNSPSDYEPYVVVHSIISTDSTFFKVQLNYSKSIYDSSDFKPVEDASVYITVKEDVNDNQTQDFFLQPQGNGLYTRSNQPIEGRNYEMIIKVDGEIVKAETYVPRVLKAEWGNKQSRVNPETNKLSVSVDIFIEEEEREEQNFYAWELVPVKSELTVNENPDFDKTVELDLDGNEISPPSITRPSNAIVRSNGLTGAIPAVSDSGGKITASFDGADSGINTPIIVETNPGQTTTSTQTFGQKYKLKVWAISYDYYHYLLSIQQNHIGNSDATFYGPYSNVTNGSGIFAGYNLKEFDVEF